MSVGRVEALLFQMTREERESVWRGLYRRGVSVEREAREMVLTARSAVECAEREGGSDELRAKACQDPKEAYYYAAFVEGCAHDETREAASRDPEFALLYGQFVDGGPHPVTREGACGSAWEAYSYALVVDRGAHDQTRAAASQTVEGAYYYGILIDREYHPQTWSGVKGTDLETLYRDEVGVPEGE